MSRMEGMQWTGAGLNERGFSSKWWHSLARVFGYVFEALSKASRQRTGTAKTFELR